MSGSDDLKQRHEVGLVGHFFIPYLEGRGVRLRNPRPGSAANGEPDVLCDSVDRVRGVEVADGYMSRADATTIWGMVRSIEREGGIAPVVTSTSAAAPGVLSELVVNPDAALAAALQGALNEHCLRRYAIPTFLLLNASHAPLASAEDASELLPRLRVPEHRYEGIFVCLTRNWTKGRVFFGLT